MHHISIHDEDRCWWWYFFEATDVLPEYTLRTLILESAEEYFKRYYSRYASQFHCAGLHQSFIARLYPRWELEGQGSSLRQHPHLLLNCTVSRCRQDKKRFKGLWGAGKMNFTVVAVRSSKIENRRCGGWKLGSSKIQNTTKRTGLQYLAIVLTLILFLKI